MKRGVQVYARIRSVVADKPDGTRWEHKFTTPAAIVGNPDGSLAIKSSRGKRLHKRFDYNGRREPFLVNPPVRKNYWREARKRVMGRDVAPRHQAAARKGWVRRYDEGYRPAPAPRRGRQPEALRKHAAERDSRSAYDRATNEHYYHMYNPPRGRRKVIAVRKNPLLQILNPPRKKMSKRRMPPALARYWAGKRKAKANPKRKRRVRRNAWRGESKRHSLAKLTGRAGPTYHKRRRKAKENPFMAKHRKHRRRRAASAVQHTNFRRRHSKRRRHNPPMRLGGVGVSSLAQQAAGVAVGIIAPTMILKMPMIPAAFTDTPAKRVATKLAVGLGVSMAARKFVGRPFGNMVLIGVAANILMADIFPKLLPQTGVGLAEGYSDLPMLSGPPGYRPQLGEFPSEGMGEFPSETSNVNEFATGS